jgi:hypothetical protein
MGLPQSSTHSGGKVCATAHGLGQDDPDAKLLDQSTRVGRKLIKPATETTASDFLCFETEAAHESGIHQMMSLIVGDDSDSHAPIDQCPRSLNDGGGLPGTQEPADTGDSGHLCHGLGSDRLYHSSVQALEHFPSLYCSLANS